jgi:Protein of unknown function (DUF2958)
MKLLTNNICRQLPPLGSTGEQGLLAVAVVKFFYPDFGWTWYGVEFDGTDIFWGYVVGDVPELGTFSLAELERNRGKWGLPIERDLWFEPTSLRELMATHEPKEN